MSTFCTSQCQDVVKVLKYHEWRCQGFKRRVRKPKHTKEHIKKDPIKYFVEKFLYFWTYFANNTDEAAFSLTHFIFVFSNYSRRSLYRVPFFFGGGGGGGLIDFYMSLYSIQSHQLPGISFLTISLRLELSGNPIQCGTCIKMHGDWSPPDHCSSQFVKRVCRMICLFR